MKTEILFGIHPVIEALRAARREIFEVYLAKEGHDGLVVVNYLEKIQLPTLPSLLDRTMTGLFQMDGSKIRSHDA